MKFNPKHTSKIMIIPSILSVVGLEGIFSEVHGFVLDNLEKKDRKYCKAPERERRGITPLKESIERGDCESFTQTVGQIMVLSEKIAPEDLSQSKEHLIRHEDEKALREKINNPLTQSGEHLFLSSGTATLIKPNIILTAAHVVEGCKNNPENCRFVLYGKHNITSYFKTIYTPEEYDNANNSKEPLNKDLEKLKKTNEVNQYINLNYKLSQINNEITINQTKSEILKIERYKKFETEEELTEIKSKISKIDDIVIDLNKKFIEIISEIDKIKKTKNYIQYEDTIRLINESNINKSKFDISIVELEDSLPLGKLDFLPLREESLDIPKDKSITTFGVSVNRIKENKNGNITNNNFQRHISIIRLDGNDQKNMFLTSKLFLPDDYASKCQLDNLDRTKMFPTRFKYNPDVDPFLRGALQPGDSGGPLIASFKNAYQIIGVAREIDSTECIKANTKEFLPGGSYLNEWTPVSIHMKWIKRTLAEIEGS